MEPLSMCRICLAEDVRMLNIVNSNLQETYEILIAVPLETKDRRPSQVCYICCARLVACYQLRVRCLQTEELLNQMIENNKSKPQLLDTNRLKIEHPINLSIVPGTSDNSDDDMSISYDDIKREPLDLIDDVQVKEEYVEGAPVETVKLIGPKKKPQVTNLHKHKTGLRLQNKQVLNKLQTVQQTDTKKQIVDNSNEESTSTDALMYKCDICDKSFIQKHHLNCHIRVHVGEKPYKCNICEKCFRKTSDLAKHIRIHTGEKPYKCGICEKCFDEKHYLSNHIPIHIGEKPYKCKRCEKRFRNTSHLSRHNRIHTGVKPYKCDVCEKCFAEKQNLSNHIRIHTGDKPFKCDICAKCFRNKSDLTKHNRIHTGEKPYKCNICKKCFRSNSDLTKHTRIHTGDKPYKCDICEKCFTDKQHLNIHIRVHASK